MTGRPDIEPQLRLLLVGTDATWRIVVQDAANRLGASLDMLPDVGAALGWMLDSTKVYSHVLALGPLGSREVDALAGMLDEVTLQPTRLLLLGCRGDGGANPWSHITDPVAESIVAALRCDRPAVPAGLPPLAAAELSAVLHGGGLRVRFQPIVRASDLHPIGLESLARIHHQLRGILHPKDFIPITVACGRERVLASIAAARTFLEIGTRLCSTDMFVSLNVPVPILLHDRVLQRGLELCAVAGVSPSKIVIEVLETRTRPDFKRLTHALEAWRGAGFRTAIDDAGPALPHWREMVDQPFDIVKLDGALVSDPAGHELLKTIVGEAKSRGRFVVAEGIEDEACLDRVRPLGVDAFQGFLFARPLPALAVPIWLSRWRQQPQTRAA